VDIEARFTIPCIAAEERGSPAEVARAVRTLRLLPAGPVRSVILTLEHPGLMVFRVDMESPRISVLSTLTGDAPPLFMLDTGQSADRQRRNQAYELGHTW
jgi:hypothetical protein